MFLFSLLTLLPFLALQIASVAGGPIEIRAQKMLQPGCTTTPGWSSSDWNAIWLLRRKLCSGQGTFQALYGFKAGADMPVKLNGKLTTAGIYMAMIADNNEAEAGGTGEFPEAECYVSLDIRRGFPVLVMMCANNVSHYRMTE
jgi:hypothetical protein